MTNSTQMKKELERWPKYKRAYLRTFQRLLEERERRGKDTEWETPEDVMQWYLGEATKRKVDPYQTEIF